ncbi:MAG: hypothetical protein ABJC10_01255 [Acidobacteriota bacterium]
MEVGTTRAPVVSAANSNGQLKLAAVFVQAGILTIGSDHFIPTAFSVVRSPLVRTTGYAENDPRRSPANIASLAPSAGNEYLAQDGES